MLDQLNLEVPGLAGNVFDFGKREQFDVDVPADLDQFGRDNSHRTVIGGKCFIKL
jgi:hypothetical protein